MSKGVRRHSWDYPNCPECESDVFVTAIQGNKYHCEACKKTFTRDYTTNEYTLNPQTKGERNNWHGKNTPIEGATETEWDMLYDEYDEFIVPRSNHSNHTRQHIIGEMEHTLCDRTSGYRQEKYRTVAKQAYPKGYNKMCKNCLRQWRKDHD